jgi:hypothetical protein
VHHGRLGEKPDPALGRKAQTQVGALEEPGHALEELRAGCVSAAQPGAGQQPVTSQHGAQGIPLEGQHVVDVELVAAGAALPPAGHHDADSGRLLQGEPARGERLRKKHIVVVELRKPVRIDHFPSGAEGGGEVGFIPDQDPEPPVGAQLLDERRIRAGSVDHDEGHGADAGLRQNAPDRPLQQRGPLASRTRGDDDRYIGSHRCDTPRDTY